MIRKIEKVTAQNMFDDAVRHMLTQRKRATNPRNKNECSYRTPGGMCCPIGARIPKEEYSPDFENVSISKFSRRVESKIYRVTSSLRAAARVPDGLAGLARAIQLIHDDCAVADWPSELRNLAIRKFLSTRCLDSGGMRMRAALCEKTKGDGNEQL